MASCMTSPSCEADKCPEHLLLCRQQQPDDHGSRRSLPRKIILIRHAESVGNVQPEAYAHMPDAEMPLVSSKMGQQLDNQPITRPSLFPVSYRSVLLATD